MLDIRDGGNPGCDWMWWNRGSVYKSSTSAGYYTIKKAVHWKLCCFTDRYTYSACCMLEKGTWWTAWSSQSDNFIL